MYVWQQVYGIWQACCRPRLPGLEPGGFPKFVAACLGILGAALSIQAFLRMKKGESCSGTLDKKELLYAVILAAIFLLYILVVKSLGYILSTILVFPAFMYVYGERRWLRMGVISVVFSIVTFYLFEKVFYVFLPHGSIF